MSIFSSTIQEHTLTEQNDDKLFLDALSLHFGYFEAGTHLPKLENINISLPTCPKEKLPYVNNDLETLLAILLQEIHYAQDVYIPKLIHQLQTTQTIFSPTHFIGCYEQFRKSIFFNDLIESFGQRGLWLHSLEDKNNKEKEETTLKKNERIEKFALLCKQNHKEAVIYLQEVFKAETFTTNLIYMLYAKENNNILALEYMQEYLNGISKKNKNDIALLNKLESIYINIEETPQNIAFTNTYPSALWKDIKHRDKLKTLLTPLINKNAHNYYDFPHQLGDVDRTICFVLASVSSKKWCELLNISLLAFIKKVSSIKRVDKNNGLDKFNFTEALTPNIVKNKDIALALALFKLSGFKYVDTNFLTLLEEEKALEFISSHFEVFKKFNINLLKLLTTLNFTKEWSEAFTQKFIEYFFASSYNDNSIAKNLWKLSPYFANNFFEVFTKVTQEKNHYITGNLEDTLFNINKIKNLINKA